MDLYLSLVSGGTLYSITKDEIGEPKQFIHLAGQIKCHVCGYQRRHLHRCA